MVETSILPEEVEQFGTLAGDWWDPNGSSAMLHKLNPVRLKYIRDQIDQHWQRDEYSRTPLEGKSALDVGCGAGLLAEPLARLGAKVTGDRRLSRADRRGARACRGDGPGDRLSRRRGGGTGRARSTLSPAWK